jgi:energy-coupling factor transporter transmembrane protein EcfT
MKKMNRLSSSSLAVWFAATLILTVFTADPYLATLSLICGIVNLSYFGLMRGGRSLILPAIFIIFSALANTVFSHRGSTELLFINGSAITLEAIISGFVTGEVLAAAAIYCTLFGEIFNDERLLSLLGSRAPKTALVLSSALHFLPCFARRYSLITDAQRAIGRLPDKGFKTRISGTLHIWSALIGLAFEDAAEQASLMRARGFDGQPKRRTFTLKRFSRSTSIVLLTASVILFLFSVASITTGHTPVTFYPLVSLPRTEKSISVYACAAILFILPSVIEIYWRSKWHFLKSKI